MSGHIVRCAINRRLSTLSGHPDFSEADIAANGRSTACRSYAADVKRTLTDRRECGRSEGFIDPLTAKA